MATKTTYTKNADWTITSRFDQVPDTPTAPAQPTNNVSYARQDNGQYTQYTQNADGTITSRFNVQNPVQPAQPTTQAPTQQTWTTYTRNADGTITSRFNQPTQPAQPAQNQNQITDWQSLPEDQKTIENLSKLVNNRYWTQSTIDWASVNANVWDMRYWWYLDEAKNPIKTEWTKLKQWEVQPNMAPTWLVFDKTSDWSALRPQDKTINNLQKLIEARYWTLAEVEWDRVVADIWWKMYQWTLDQNGNPVKTEVPADNTQFNSWEILEQLKANPNLDLSTYDPTQAAIAKNNFTKIQNFDWMNSDQLNESLQSGALLVWTEVRNNMNPQQRQIVDMVSTLNMIKWIFLDPLLINENAEKNILANAWPLAQALEDNYLSTAEVDEITITPEMKQMKDNADFWWDEMNRLRTNYEYLEDDIEEELKWQNATASYRDRLMAKEWKALYRALTTAQRNYQMYYWQYNDERERAMQLLNTNIQLYQKAQDRAYEEEQQLKERQWQLAMQNYGMVTDYMNTLENRAYNEQRYEYEMAKELEQAQKKLEMQLQLQYWDLNSDNPMLVQQAIRRSLQGMYDTYSSLVPWLENPEISYEKVMQKIANGMSPAQALQERHDEIKNSKRLQNALANEQNKLNYDNWKMQQDMNPTSYSWYSGAWYSWYSWWVSNWDVTINYWVSEWSGTNWALRITTADWYWQMCTPTWDASANGVWGGKFVTNQDTWYQCWWFARRRAWLNETPWWNSLAERKKMFDQETPVAWWLVLFTDWYDSTYWHIAYVREVRSDWTMVVEESNLVWPNKYSERVISQNTPWVWGFYNNTPAAKNTYEKIVQQAQQQAQLSNGEKSIFQLVWENPDINIWKLTKTVYWWNASDPDRQSIERAYNELTSQWIPYEYIMAWLSWLRDVPLWKEKEAMKFVDILQTIWEEDYKWLNTRYINGGDTFGFVLWKVDDKLYKNDKDNTVTTSKLKSTSEQIDYMIDLINKAKNDKQLWLVYWTLNESIWKKLEAKPEYQDLVTLLTSFTADERKKYAWSAVTDQEMKALENYIWLSSKWQPDNLIQALTTIKNKNISEYFNQRWNLYNENELKDYLENTKKINLWWFTTYTNANKTQTSSSSTSYNANSKFAQSYYWWKY